VYKRQVYIGIKAWGPGVIDDEEGDLYLEKRSVRDLQEVDAVTVIRVLPDLEDGKAGLARSGGLERTLTLGVEEGLTVNIEELEYLVRYEKRIDPLLYGHIELVDGVYVMGGIFPCQGLELTGEPTRLDAAHDTPFPVPQVIWI
jgi:hypothetical protein